MDNARWTDETHARADSVLAATMFTLSIVVLALLAFLLHVIKPEAVLAADAAAARQEHWQLGLAIAVAALYPFFWCECVYFWWIGNAFWKQHLLCCFLPPIRLGLRDHRSGTRVWFPKRGWVTVEKTVRERLERSFSVPMILFALLVLPVILVEHYYSDQFSTYPWLSLSTGLASGLIWFAFSFEFIVMMSVVDKRLDYCRQNWIDLVVILLPLVAFLRMARLSRLVKLKQLSKTARVYRMRGVLMRTYRALLVLELVERLLMGGPEKRLKRLRHKITEKEHELEQLRRREQQLLASIEKLSANEESRCQVS